MKTFMMTMCLMALALGLIACSQIRTNANATELDLGKSGSVRSSPPLDSGRLKVNVLSGESSHTQIIANRKRMIALAKIFLGSFNSEECNAYFTEEYPPTIYYDLIVGRYHVFVERGDPNDVIEMIFDNSAEKGTIRLKNRIVIGDPPTKGTRWDSCQLLEIARFKAIVNMYFTNGKPKEELMEILSSPTIQNPSELDLAKSGSACSSPTPGSGRFKGNVLSGESSDTQIIATRKRIISRAELFLESYEYREEDFTKYFTKEYPPNISYDLMVDRFYVILDGGHLGDRITMVFDKALKNANLIFPSGIGLGDVPTGDTTKRKDCQLFAINRFKTLLDRYFGDLYKIPDKL